MGQQNKHQLSGRVIVNKWRLADVEFFGWCRLTVQAVWLVWGTTIIWHYDCIYQLNQVNSC